MSDLFDLTVTVDAADWAYLHRRLDYLETLLRRLAQDEAAVQEWFSAAELAAMNLPGLPAGKSAIGRKAAREDWVKRTTRRHGSLITLYHVSALPARSFDALLARVLALPLPTGAAAALDLAAPQLATVVHVNTAPPWVLPLMRLMKGEAQGDLGRAWQSLPDHLPAGTVLPDVTTAAQVLVALGLA